MPTYDYKCKHCRHQFETMHGITEAPLRKCPKCGRNGLKRLIGAGAGIIFKGSGFYINDYGRRGTEAASPKPSAKKPSGSESSASSGSSESSGSSGSGASSAD